MYVADQFADQRFEIFAAPIDGSSAPVRVNSPLAAGGDVHFRPEISADGEWIVYTADQDVPDRFELYAAPVDGSAAPVKLNGPLAVDTNVAYLGFDQPQFQITADVRRVLFMGDPEREEQFELYSVPLDRSSPQVRLSGPMVAGGDVRYASNSQKLFLLTPDQTRVLYLADQDVDETVELYVAPVDGSAPSMRLNGPLVPGGDVLPTYSGRAFLQFTPDSERVLYLADQDADEVYELYAVPLDGSRAAKKLNGLLAPGGDVQPGFQITPDGSRVVYGADQRLDGVFELFEASLDDSRAPRRLNSPPIPAGDVFVGPLFEITPDGSRVLFVADLDSDDVLELHESLLSRPASRRAPGEPGKTR